MMIIGVRLSTSDTKHAKYKHHANGGSFSKYNLADEGYRLLLRIHKMEVLKLRRNFSLV
jgi:hypothetical protein